LNDRACTVLSTYTRLYIGAEHRLYIGAVHLFRFA
jgi:hypothetical protein